LLQLANQAGVVPQAPWEITREWPGDRRGRQPDACTAKLAGQAEEARVHPAGTVRGWIRGARRSAAQLRITGIRAVLASGQDGLLAWTRTDELGGALEHLAAAALVLGRRHGLEHTSWWARINMLTRGWLLTMAPAG